MAWEVVYADLSSYSSETHSAGDLPLDGLQAVVVDGKASMGLDCCAWGQVDGKEAIILPKFTTSYEQMVAAFPDATVVRGKTISTSQIHKVEVMVGLWHPKNLKPDAAEPDWMKDVIGWRLWTSTEVFDSVGVAEQDWLAHWASLPSEDIQYLKLYENWKDSAGDDQTQNHAASFYFMAPSPHGLIIAGSEEGDLDARYPGTVVKNGRQISNKKFAVINAAADASKNL